MESNTKTEIETMIETAIETSIHENRSVAITLPFVDDIYTIGGHEDHARENDGTYDVWGTTDEGSEWRLSVTIPETIYVDEAMVTDGEDLSDFSIETFAKELTERTGRTVVGLGGNGALGKNRGIHIDEIIPSDVWDAAFAAAVTTKD